MEIKQYLEKLGITFKTHVHPPLFTCADADKYYLVIPGVHAKNLFVKTKTEHFLIVLPFDKRLDTKVFSKEAGEKISFADDEDLDRILHVKPGSVSPFALINDSDGKVKLIIDKTVWESETVSFHPNINTETLELSGKDFHKYVESLKNKHEIKNF